MAALALRSTAAFVWKGIGISDSSKCPNGWMANTSEEIVGAHPILPGSKPVLPMEKPHDGERPNLEVAVRALRRLLFATWILSGLAFALVCYAEMLGVVQVD
jgi:hypothetical protein